MKSARSTASSSSSADFDVFAHIAMPIAAASAVRNELDDYLTSPREAVNGDPLAWWWEHRRTYPKLSRMALDYLSVPGEYIVVL